MDLELTTTTKHLATLYFDILLSQEKVLRQVVGYLAVVCLCIASKLQGDGVQRLAQYKSSVLATLRSTQSTVDLNALELTVMQALSWQAALVTAPDVAQIFLALLLKNREDAQALEEHATKIMELCLTGTRQYSFDLL